MDFSSAEEAYARLYPHSDTQAHKDEFWSVIQHLDLADDWELEALPYKISVRGTAFSIIWGGYPKRTSFRRVADRIFVSYDRYEDEYLVQIPVLIGEHRYRGGDYTELDKVTFNDGESAAEHVNGVASKARRNMMRNAFIETNHWNAVRAAYDPVSGQFLFGEEMEWLGDAKDTSARVYTGEEAGAIEQIDYLNGRKDSTYEAEGEQINPDDPKTTTIHSPRSVVSVHGVGEETEYNVAFQFGTYDNVASASVSDIISQVDTSSYYDPDLTELRNRAVSAIQIADRIYENRTL